MKKMKIIGYYCEYCNTKHKTNEDIIIISGQYYGLGDMDYEYYFCNITCLKGEIDKYNKLGMTEEYVYILQKGLNKNDK